MRHMRTHTKLVLCTLAAVAGAAFLGYQVAIQRIEQPICNDVVVLTSPPEVFALPPPPASPQLLPPLKRAQKRRIFPSAVSHSVEQCAPGPVSSSRPHRGDDESMNYVPEPGSAVLAGVGLAALAIARARASRKEGA